MKSPRWLLPVLILMLGAEVAWYWVVTKPSPQQKPVMPPSALVEVVRASRGEARASIKATGTVIPAQEVLLHPQVSGRVVEINPRLVPGGRFHRGEMILRIDPRDYEYAADQARARVTQAESDLKMEQGRKVVAEREWELFKDELSTTPEGQALAQRHPQIASARAALAAAEGALKQAELNLERTTLRAPFATLVVTEDVEVGQVVSPQSRIASLVGTQAYWVQVSVPVQELAHLTFPADGRAGSPVTVVHDLGKNNRVVRKGTVQRLLGNLDTAGRLARVLVVIRDPLGLDATESDVAPPLLLGAYVRVSIEGLGLGKVFALPRSALREDRRVWLVDTSNRLTIRSVTIVWRTPETVYISKGLEEGDQVITSTISAPAPGTRVHARGAPSASLPGPRSRTGRD